MEKLLATTEQKIVPALRSAEDLEALKRRLQRMFDKRNQAYFAALFTLGIHLLFVLPNPGLIRTFGWGILVANTVMNFFHGVCVYFVYSFAFWAFTELKEYDFSLYSLDPSSSEIVRILAGMFNAVLYTILVMITIITIVFVRFKVLTPVSVVITMVLMWVTASAIFTFNQLILARIIQKGKWKTLNEIQAEIIALQIKETPPSSETLEHIDKLVNLHNSVKATPNSALSLRSFLEFINSLLLPTIGVVLSTINDVQGLVEKLLKLKLF